MNEPQNQQTQNINNGQQPPIAQSVVKYHKPGTSILTPSVGLLEWSADSTIRLYSINHESRQVDGTVFAFHINQILRVDENQPIGLIFFTKDGNRYQANFDSNSLNWLAAGGGIGLVMSQRSYQETGVFWWVQSLQQQGINVRTGMKNPALVTGVVLGIVLFIAVLIYVLSTN